MIDDVTQEEEEQLWNPRNNKLTDAEIDQFIIIARNIIFIFSHLLIWSKIDLYSSF